VVLVAPLAPVGTMLSIGPVVALIRCVITAKTDKANMNTIAKLTSFLCFIKSSPSNLEIIGRIIILP